MSAAAGGNGAPTADRPRPRWTLRPPPPPAVVESLERNLGLPRALCRLLAVRKQQTPDAAKSFLRPLIGGLHEPAGLLGAEAAARRLVQAVHERELVVVHGDYDVDGVAGAALLTRWLRSLGGRADAIVPHRVRHGYDLSAAGVARAVERRARVLVTVDCGIQACEPVRQAVAAGIDVIVTDHHRPDAALPPALAVVNPSQPGCAYPNKDLCGAAVAFKVGQLVARALGRPDDDAWEHLDLVALATIADQVPLSGENRTLARYGLRAAARSTRPGLAALLTRSRALRNGGHLDAAAVAYRLAPRINAAGRVGDADVALRLLLTSDLAQAAALADELENANRERRRLEDHVLAEAIEAATEDYDPARDRAVLVAKDGWHPGVVGIVASRLAERLFRPAAVVAMEGERGRGSVRSIPSFDVHAALSRCAEHVERFGGHRQAAGFDVRRDRLPGLRTAFRETARSALGEAEPMPELAADLEIGLDETTRDLHRWLRYLGPFGRGNPEPVFVARGVRFDRAKVTPRGHLSFRMVQGRAALPGIGFGMGSRFSTESLGAGPVDVAFRLSDNTFQGHTTIQAKALDIRPPSRRLRSCE